MPKPSIFISYSSRDRDWAKRLEQALQQAGYQTWRDETRIDTDWSAEVAQALARQDVVCLLWTANARDSNWVQHEWLTARALEKRIVPLLPPDAPALPRPLLNVEGVAADGVSFEGLLALLARIPSWRVQYDYTVLPPRSFLPFLPNPNFVGRGAELVQLYLNLIGNLQNLGTRQTALVGMGGSGKTQLAIEFGYRFSYAFEAGVYWIQAANSNEWLTRLVELARDRLSLTVADPAGPLSARQYLFALQSYCKSHPQTLVIFDNVEDPALLSRDEPLGGAGVSMLTLGCGLLFTSRVSVPLPGVTEQVLDVLQPGPAYTLIASKRAPAGKDDEDDIRKICEAVGYLPLAVVLAAGYLQNYQTVSLHDYSTELTSSAIETVDFEPVAETGATRHVACVAATLRSQWEALKEETARRILRLACSFPESAIVPLARIALLCGPLPVRSAIDRPFERACRLLWSVSMADASADKQAIRIHPLVRDFVNGLFAVAEQAAFRAQAEANVETAYSDPLRLKSEFERRGVDEILSDIQVAVAWSPPARNLARLALLLDRERGHLSAGFLAQLQHRAISMGESDRAARIAQAMAKPAILTSAVNQVEDESWIRTFAGHQFGVSALSAHPDGRRFLSGSQDKNIALWDIERSQIVRSFKGDAQVTCLSRVWDGRYVLAGYDDASLIVWDIETGEVVRSWKHETPSNWANVTQFAKFDRANPVCAVFVNPSATLAVSGVHSFRDQLAIWDLATGEKRANPVGHLNGVLSLAIDPSGQTLASGSWDHTVALWNLQTGERHAELTAHTDGVRALAFSPDGRWLVSGADDRKIIVWDAQSGVALKTLEGHAGWVTALAFTDAKRIVSASFDSSLKLWNLESGRAVATFRGHSGPVRCLAVTQQFVLSGGDDRTIRYWRALELNSADAAAPISVLSLSADKTFLLAASLNEFSQWSTAGIRRMAAAPFTGGEYKVTGLSATAQRALFIEAKHGTGIVVWDLRQAKVLLQTPVAQRTRPRLSDDGSRVLAVNAGPNLNDNNAAVLDVASGHKKLLAAGEFAIVALALSADGRRALTVGAVESRVWDLESGNLIRSLKSPFAAFRAEMDEQGRFALIDSANDCPAIWNLDTGVQVSKLGRRWRFIQGMALSSDLAVICGDEPSLNVFRVDTGEHLATLLLSSSVADLRISGNAIFLADASGRLWSFDVVVSP